MYIQDGIVYAGERKQLLKVVGVRPLDDYKLWVRFSTGESKIFDIKRWLEKPAFTPLKNEETFRSVYIDYGATVWNNGEIDIAPECLYENGIAMESPKNGEC